jgi:hypothetical protein
VCEIEYVKVWIAQVQKTKKERDFLCKFTPSLIKRKNRVCGVVVLCVCILSHVVCLNC